jgi:outer membrane protein
VLPGRNQRWTRTSLPASGAARSGRAPASGRRPSLPASGAARRRRAPAPARRLGLAFCLALVSGLPLPFDSQVGSPAPLGAQEIRGALTLEEAIRLARHNNPEFLRTANDEEVAEWGVREAYGEFLPRVSSNVSGQYLAPGSPSFGIFDAGDLGLAVTDYYFSGYQIQASYSIQGSSLFRVASARADREATRAGIQAAEYTLESEVTAQYLMALRAGDEVEVSRRLLARAEEGFELADARVEVGAAIPTDAKQAEVERGRARVSLIEAESRLRNQKLLLLELMGVQAPEDFELSGEVNLFEPDWDRNELVDRALDRHPRLQAFRAQEQARIAGMRRAWSGYLPNLYLAANWSGRARQIGDENYLLTQARSSVASQKSSCQLWNHVSAGLSQPLEGYPRDCGGFVLTPEQEARILANNDVFPFNFRQEPFSFYMQVSFPVFQGFSRQRQVAEARNAANDARHDRRAEELRVRTAVTQAHDELLTALQVVEIEARNREVAEEQLMLAQERYRLGAASFMELLEAQSSAAAAERDYLNAKYRFHGAIWALEAEVGERLRPESAGLR